MENKSKDLLVEVDVCVVGLGVSSLALVRRLDQDLLSKKKGALSYVVLSETDFGVWKLLHTKGEDFDLISSKGHSGFSWWDCDEVQGEFPFFSASEYYSRLLEEITPTIQQHTLREKAVAYRQRSEDGKFQVHSVPVQSPSSHNDSNATSSRLRVLCKHLVITPGFDFDSGGICNLLQESLQIQKKTVFIDHYGDTANMVMARLMLGDNKVIIGSRHFQHFDKVFNIGTNEKKYWAAFDNFEEYTYLYNNNQARHMGTMAHCTVAPYYNRGLSKLFLKRSGVTKLIQVDDFTLPNTYPGLLSTYVNRKGVTAGFGYPTKHWPVHSYFAMRENFCDKMLKHRVLLNDPYFFSTLGRVRVVHSDRVQKLSERQIQIGDEVIDVDVFISNPPRAVPNQTSIELLESTSDKNDGKQKHKQWKHRYTENLHGIWSADRPNIHFVGVERPTTGAYASTGEMQCEFHYKLMTDPAFKERMMEDYEINFQNWKHNLLNSGATLPGMEHTQFSGMTNLSLARLMNVDMTFASSLWNGELLDYMNGTHVPFRYEKLTNAKEKYLRHCRSLSRITGWSLYMKLLWSILLALNLVMFGIRARLWAWTLSGVVLLFPWSQKIFRCLVENVVSYGGDRLARHMCLAFAMLLLTNGALSLDIIHMGEVSLLSDVLLLGGPLVIPVIAANILYAYWYDTFLFNDCRSHENFVGLIDAYLEDVRSTDWYKHATRGVSGAKSHHETPAADWLEEPHLLPGRDGYLAILRVPDLKGTKVEATKNGTGQGLFTTRSFKKDEIVLRSKVSILEAKCTEGNILMEHVSSDGICQKQYDLDVTVHCCKRHDGTIEVPGGLDLFLNHSCQPNLATCDIEWLEDGTARYALKTTRELSAGEECTVDYDLIEYDSGEDGILECQCGTAKCRRTIAGYKFLTQEQREELPAPVPPVLIAVQELEGKSWSKN